MNWKERHYAEKLTLEQKDQTVHLAGWVDTIRDHGHLLFLHIRDVSGIVQLVFDPTRHEKSYQKAQNLHNEYVISITGTVRERADDAKNPHIQTGDIEVEVETLTVLNSATTPPFVITEKKQIDEEGSDSDHEFNVDEDIRLRYRFLDLRRQSMQARLITRHKIMQTIREFLNHRGFHDVETPVLTKSTPEGARDYLVPSRLHPHQFYALPQSPQLFKQLLMMSGLDRYYQIVRCFRDEDLRPNRQPEFTQLDMEASFIDETFIYETIEELLCELFANQGITLQRPFVHISYDDAMNKYGNDRPDLRYDMTLIDVTQSLKNVNYRIFQSIIQGNGAIKGINVKGAAASLSKSYIQEDLIKKHVPKWGAKGMSWMKVENGQLVSNIVQFFSDDEQQILMDAMGGEDGDVFFFIADTNKALVNDVLGRLRAHIADRLGLIDPQVFAPCWVVDFPLFEQKDGRLHSIHHPFTMPYTTDFNTDNVEELLALRSRAYDVVINGEEIGGGSIRIHDPEVQSKIFTALGLSADNIDSKFGFFVNALQYGTPPHGGIALGMDRLVSMLCHTESIREVIAFPKNRVAGCPLTNAPSDVAEDQLDDVHLMLKKIPETVSK